jgi:hypothetical protein
MELIDKDKVVAEIEKLIKYDEMVMNHDAQITELLSRELNTLYELSSFVKSLKVEEVDLEKEFDKCCENYIFDDECEVYTARKFFKLGFKAKGE